MWPIISCTCPPCFAKLIKTTIIRYVVQSFTYHPYICASFSRAIDPPHSNRSGAPKRKKQTNKATQPHVLRPQTRLPRTDSLLINMHLSPMKKKRKEKKRKEKKRKSPSPVNKTNDTFREEDLEPQVATIICKADAI